MPQRANANASVARRTYARRLAGWALVAGTAAVSAGVWVVARLVATGDLLVALPTFLGACNRIKGAGLPILPQDQVCQSSFWLRWQLNISASTLLVAAGAVFAGIILAAAGRKAWAFLPMLPLMYQGFWSSKGFGTPLIESNQFPGRWGSHLFGIALMSAPVVVALLCARKQQREPWSKGWKRRLQATLLLALATGGAWWILRYAAANFFGVRWDWGVFPWSSAACLLLFGLLLGPDRRFWPWALAPTALLLSWGPTFFAMMPIETANRPRPLFMFGFVVPLFLLGLMWSGWGPLQRKLDGASLKGLQSKSQRIRPAVVLNSFVAGCLVLTVLAARNDQYIPSFDTSMSTYLSGRTAAQDMATRRNLWNGLQVMRDYKHEHSTYAGFTVEDGRTTAPNLPWRDPRIPMSQGIDDFGVTPVTATAGVARLAELDGNGSAWCIQQKGGVVSYGSGESGMDSTSQFALSISHCDEHRWSNDALNPPPYPDCSGLSAYLICRMVYVLMYKIVNGIGDGPPSFGYVFDHSLLVDVPPGWSVNKSTSGVPSLTVSAGKKSSQVSVTVVEIPGAHPSGQKQPDSWVYTGINSLYPNGPSSSSWAGTLTRRFAFDNRSVRITISLGRDANAETISTMEQMVGGMKDLSVSPSSQSTYAVPGPSVVSPSP